MRFRKVCVGNSYLSDLRKKPVSKWTLFNKFKFFKHYYYLCTGRYFEHDKNFGLFLIKIKKLDLSNKEFIRYIVWLKKTNKLYGFNTLKYNLDCYKRLIGIKK